MKYILFSFAVLLALGIGAFGQNYRYDSPFPSISASSPPFLVANVPPNSPTLSVCHSPANQVPCTNYATTYTSSSVACSNGAQDTPQPQPSACQSTGDAQGNIGFWAPAGTYDYTVCISNNCFGPYTITIGGGGGGGGTPNQAVSFTSQISVPLGVSSDTANIVWDCYDNNNPANAISPNTVFLNLSTYVVTFTFFNPQSGYCVVNSSGGSGGSYTLPTQYTKLRCESGLGDGLNAIAAGTYLQTFCYNDSGVTWTISGIKCFTDNSGTSTLNVMDNLSNALLTGPITCSNSFAAGTQSSTVTILSGGYAEFTFVSDGTSKQSTWLVSMSQ
jgi:hypothetical protein